MKDGHSHPSPKTYIMVALVLAVVTVIELFIPNLGLGAIQNPLLLVLTVVKVGLVALFFMHLKFDSRLYSALFAVGYIFAIPFAIVLIILLAQ